MATVQQQRILVGGGDAGREALAQARSRTMWRMLSDSAASYPDKVALVGADDAGHIRKLTYSELVARVRSLSVGLASIGVRRGDRVVLWMTNSLEWIVAAQATMRLGAAVVPVNTFLKPAEIKYVLAQSGARHLILLDRFRKLDLPAMLAEICPAFGEAREPGMLSDTELPDLRNVVLLARFGGTHPRSFDFAALEALGDGPPAELLGLTERMTAATEPTDLGMVKYTSGSTGFPKGVMLEQGGIVASGLLHGRRIDATDQDVFFSMMPFFHGGGSIWGQMTMLPIGGTLVFTEAFDPKLAVKLLHEERATIQFGVLAQEVAEEAMAQGLTFPAIRNAPLPSDDCRKIMPNVVSTIMPFGLTECYGPGAVNSPSDPPGATKLLDGMELRVVDPETGEDVAPGQAGEAWLRGNVMRGYWNKPEETARALTPDGWLRSEDLIRVDEDGVITYAGRIKLMLKVGGENVSIEEVENTIETHQDVAHCGAVGVPDARRGEAVRIYVVARTGRTIDEATLRPWIEQRLARFKQPREIVVVAELPRLANGKKDRVTLAGWAKEEIAV